MKKYRMLAIAMMTTALLAPANWAQAPAMMQGGMQGMHSHSTKSDDESSMMSCNDMAKAHQEMMTKMKSMDAKLDGLIAEMNAATGSAKVDKMAAVINELVSQRSRMRDRMMSMQPMMMKHMMGHMDSGSMKGMSDCPMMGEMASGDTMKHEKHH